jgi:hypothetical protein
MENQSTQPETAPTPPATAPQPLPTNPPAVPTIPPASLPKKHTVLFLAIGIGILLISIGAGAYYLGTRQNNSTINSPPPSSQTQQAPLYTGQLKRLSQNLMIFKTTEDDKLNGIENNFVYYEAGVFAKGSLQGYSRVVAIRPVLGPGDPITYILATKDYQTYILDDPDNNAKKYPESDYQNPYSVLDKSRIASTAVFDTEQPRELTLDKKFSLYQEDFFTETSATGKTDKNSNIISETVLSSDFTSFQKLSSPLTNLDIYYSPIKYDNSYLDKMTPEQKELTLLRQKYLLGYTEVEVVDSTGLPVTYALTTPENIKTYQAKLTQFKIDLDNYNTVLKEYQAKQIGEYPQYPTYVSLPNLGFTGTQINSNQNNLQFFKIYETAIPGACSGTLNSPIVNVTDSELEQIGTVSGLALYRLKDANHPLYSLAFKNKMDYYDQSPSEWDLENKGITKPTLVEYISSNPLLFIKDYWQRWVALGEYDIQLPGGCGKPVIYLYPKEPINISVKFQVPVQLTTDIPTYAGSWQVKAYPNGSLINLKPELTDCSKIDYRKKGSEYAQEACQKNSYPYLYWAGNINSTNYPTINDGWVVDRNNLDTFLQSKLTEVGLNNKEKNDFMGYWLPDMLAKNTPYYRVSFLQTSDLNSLFPMTVTPSPETTFRLFLDYLPLTAKPDILPQPQVLNKLVRSGFTLVEWGGLKQP